MIRAILISVVCLLGLFNFTSCSEDGDDITGVYKIVSFATSECENPLENFTFDFSGSDGCDIVLGIEICGEGTLTLNEDNTYSLMLTLRFDDDSDTLSASGEYTSDGNTITICDNGTCESATYDSGSGRIALSYADDSCTVTITGQK